MQRYGMGPGGFLVEKGADAFHFPKFNMLYRCRVKDRKCKM